MWIRIFKTSSNRRICTQERNIWYCVIIFHLDSDSVPTSMISSEFGHGILKIRHSLYQFSEVDENILMITFDQFSGVDENILMITFDFGYNRSLF